MHTNLFGSSGILLADTDSFGLASPVLVLSAMAIIFASIFAQQPRFKGSDL
jgi:hypothetical protein